jgi:hypothetical protein
VKSLFWAVMVNATNNNSKTVLILVIIVESITFLAKVTLVVAFEAILSRLAEPGTFGAS